MNVVGEAISDLTYAYEALIAQVEQLSDAEMAEVIVTTENGYTIKGLLSQLVGWQDYVLETLPALVTTINTKLQPVDVAARNRQAMMQHQHQTAHEILAEFGQKHHEIVELLRSTSPEELLLRRTMGPKVFTIKSYVIDTIQNEILKCADDIRVWQAARTSPAQ
jgi:hypothetical protein